MRISFILEINPGLIGPEHIVLVDSGPLFDLVGREHIELISDPVFVVPRLLARDVVVFLGSELQVHVRSQMRDFALVVLLHPFFVVPVLGVVLLGKDV